MDDTEKRIKEIIIGRYGSLKKFCEVIHMPWTTLDSILKRGIINSNISNVMKITKELGFDTESLVQGNFVPATSRNTCPQCGFSFFFNDSEEQEEHQWVHHAYEKAIQKFGDLYCDSVQNEHIKAANRSILKDINASLDERYRAEIQVLRCLFSRSVAASHFNLNHVNFFEYIAMLLNTNSYREKLDSELSQKLIKQFGTMPGINEGETYYHIPVSPVIPIMIEQNRDTDSYSRIMQYYKKLNSNSQDKVVTYAKNLLTNQQLEEELSAAHSRTDIEHTTEGQKHDTSIMDDDSEWK